MILVALVLVCCLIAARVLIFSWKSGFWAGNYYSTPYFSPTKFKGIKIGTPWQDVRELLGPPLRREKRSSAQHWIYSLPIRPEKPYVKYEVTLDYATSKVVNTSRRRDLLALDPKSGKWIGYFPPKPTSSWEITSFDYPMIQGKRPDIGVNSEKSYLIQVMATWCKPCSRGRDRVEGLLKKDLGNIPLQMLLVSVDESEEAVKGYIKENQITMSVVWDPNSRFSKPMSKKLIPQYLLLRNKIVYPFDFPHYTGMSEEYYSDLTWFVRCHAGADSSSKD